MRAENTGRNAPHAGRELAAPLRIAYEPCDEISPQSASSAENCLASIRFGDRNAIHRDQPGVIQVGLQQLCGAPLAEVWHSSEAVIWQQAHGFQFGTSGSLLFGYRLIEEAPDAGIEQVSEDLYSDLFKLLIETRYPHLLRIWNYFADINSEQGSVGQAPIERYRAFTKGRFQAIEKQAGFGRELSASTAIGGAQSSFLVYFLASRNPGVHIENPRQLSAFLYPSEYGPRSPSFSRATLARMPGSDHLYISGTASIVGHETCHIDKVSDQLDETLNNLDVIVAHAADHYALNIQSTQDLSLLKVYVRNPQDLPEVQRGLARRLRTAVPTVFLKGDICRSDLLLEIEGLYVSAD